MNEYQDQSRWFEIQTRTLIPVPGLDGFNVPTPWEGVATADTEPEADGIADEIRGADDELQVRVIRVSGLPS